MIVLWSVLLSLGLVLSMFGTFWCSVGWVLVAFIESLSGGTGSDALKCFLGLLTFLALDAGFVVGLVLLL